MEGTSEPVPNIKNSKMTEAGPPLCHVERSTALSIVLKPEVNPSSSCAFLSRFVPLF
jgi:hypothetical protein